MSIALTGAAGHLGSTILRLLKETDDNVYCFLQEGQVPVVEDSRFHYAYGDVCDIKSLEHFMVEIPEPSTCTLIHSAAIISIQNKVSSELYRVNVEGVRNILNLCYKYEIKKLVHVSSVHAIPELPKGQVMTEPEHLSADAVVGAYAKTKAEAAQLVLGAAADGLDAVVVYPSGILGPYDNGNNHLTQMVRDYLDETLPAGVKGGYDFADVRDVARGCLLAAARGKRGNGYILSGHYMSIGEILHTAGAYAGKKDIPELPLVIAKLGLPFISLYSKIKGIRPLYTSYALHTVSCNGCFSRKKAEDELGYTVRDAHETIRDMTEWMLSLKK